MQRHHELLTSNEAALYSRPDMTDMTEFADNLNAFIESVHHQSRMTHSGVVIAAAAILDTRLEHVIKQALRPMSKAMYARLFGSFRPLNSLSGKIIMAYALGAITRDVFDELEKIRAIRNEFAHSAKLLHFDSATIAPKFIALKKPPTNSTRPTEVFLECVRVIDRLLDAYLLRTAVSQEPDADSV